MVVSNSGSSPHQACDSRGCFVFGTMISCSRQHQACLALAPLQSPPGAPWAIFASAAPPESMQDLEALKSRQTLHPGRHAHHESRLTFHPCRHVHHQSHLTFRPCQHVPHRSQTRRHRNLFTVFFSAGPRESAPVRPYPGVQRLAAHVPPLVIGDNGLE